MTTATATTIETDDFCFEATSAIESEDEKDPCARRCLVTGVVRPVDDLIRFVVDPDDRVVPDIDRCLPGRGLWVSAEHEVLERAVAKRMFVRAAKRAVRVEPDLVQRTVALLEQRCLKLIGLARRAGQLVAGFDKVRGVLRAGSFGKAGPVAALLAAADGADDGRSKLRSLARGLPLIELFTASALGAALGRERTVHAAIACGGLANRLIIESRCLTGLGFSSSRPESGRVSGLT
ncbi:YlxR domain-containing protein [uncultured Gammaproteobacteria bacterium]